MVAAYSNSAENYYEFKKYKESFESLEKGLKMLPNHPTMSYSYAVTLKKYLQSKCNQIPKHSDRTRSTKEDLIMKEIINDTGMNKNQVINKIIQLYNHTINTDGITHRLIYAQYAELLQFYAQTTNSSDYIENMKTSKLMYEKAIKIDQSLGCDIITNWTRYFMSAPRRFL